MKYIKITLLSLIVFLNSIMTSGCWNYREIDKLAVVAGVAIDKGTDERYKMTVEIVQFIGKKEARTTSSTMTIEGKSIFDAARNAIAFSGQRLYWSHTKVVILSEEVAQEGVIKAIDWFKRDSETRADIDLLISRAHSSKDILEAQSIKNAIKSFEMREMIDNQRSLSKAPRVQLWEFLNSMMAKGVTAIAPTVDLEVVNDVTVPHINGTAIFKKDKLIGFIDGEETKDILFVQDKIEGGLIIHVESESKEEVPLSLEIFNSKTKINPLVNKGNVEFKVHIETTVALAELEGSKDFNEETTRLQLESSIERVMKARIERTIKKIQHEYKADVFGLGKRLREDKPKLWNSLESNWETNFEDAKINVVVKVHIKNSAMLSKPITAEE